MNDEKKRDLESRGWTFGDAEDFLEMTPHEKKLLDRLAVGRKRLMDATEEELRDYIEFVVFKQKLMEELRDETERLGLYNDPT